MLSELQHKATLNPLHISRYAPTSTPSPPPESKGRRVLQYIVRFIVFLVGPLIYVWQMENSFVQKHLLILTYIQVLYIVVFQGVLIQSFLDQRSKIIKMMLVTVILYTLTCVVCELLPEETVVNAATQSEDCGKCGECEIYTKEDIPSEYAGNFFPPGKSKVLGIGTSLNGTRLSKAAIKRAMGSFGILLAAVRNKYDKKTNMCNNMIFDLVLGSIVGPCNSKCEASKLSTVECIKNIEEKACVNAISGFDYDSPDKCI